MPHIHDVRDAARQLVTPETAGGGMEHKCAIMAVARPAAYDGSGHPGIFAGLNAQSNRGRHGWGIAAFNPPLEQIPVFRRIKPIHEDAAGLSENAIERMLEKVHGRIGIGHNRYATSGITNSASAQPWQNSPRSPMTAQRRFVTVFNGNIANARDLRHRLAQEGVEFGHGENTTDTEVLTKLINWIDLRHQKEFGGLASTRPADFQSIFEDVDREIDGACSLILLDGTGRLVGYNQKDGFRPWNYVYHPDGSLYVASETAALKQFAAPGLPVSELKPGHILQWEPEKGALKLTPVSPAANSFKCALEDVYFARHDSEIYGRLVSDIRHMLGTALGQQIGERINRLSHQEKEKLVITAVPNTAVLYARAFADALGLPGHYHEAIIRDPAAGRTFQASTSDRRQTLEKKFSFDPAHIDGKILFVIDDSIVRGSTSVFINEKVRSLGAEQCHWFVGSPPIRGSCYYGIATATYDELLVWQAFRDIASAAQRAVMTGETPPELARKMADLIGADSISYLGMEPFKARLDGPAIVRPAHCYACMDGQYPTPAGREQDDRQKAHMAAFIPG